MPRVIDRSRPPQEPKEKGSSKKACKQMPLIDTTPENLKEIQPWADKYYDLIRERLAVEKTEAEAKVALIEACHKSGIKPDKDGKIFIAYEDTEIELIVVEKVKVKKRKDEAA